MSNRDEEIKYKEVINILKGLPRINAPKNFETVLSRRINQGFSEEKKSFRERFLSPSRLLPSAALAVSAVLMLFVLNQDTDENENLLFAEPRIREDFTAGTTMSKNELKEQITGKVEDPALMNEEEPAAESKGWSGDSTFMEDTQIGTANRLSSSITSTEFVIDKEGLNFRQVNLNKEEKLHLNRLKAKMKTLLDSDNGQY